MSHELDILVVAYHARKELIQTLASIALFTAPGYRLTVYENAANNYPLTWIWNRFVEQSRRPYIALCNADIIVGPDWDTECLKCLKSRPDVGVVQPVANYGRHNEIYPLARSYFKEPMDIEASLEVTKALRDDIVGDGVALGDSHDLILGHCFVFPRESWVKVGGFDERIPYGGNEYEFSRQLVLHGLRLAVTRKSFAYHLWNRSAVEAKARGQWDEAGNRPKFKPPPANSIFAEI